MADQQHPPPGWDQPPGGPPGGQPPGGQPPPGGPPPAQPWQGTQPYPPSPQGQSGTNGFGIAALICGLLALPLAIFLFGGLLGLVALVLGILGLRKARELAGAGRGMSITGIVTGVLAMLLAALVLAGVMAIFQDPEFREFQEMLEEELERQEELQEELED